MIRVFICITVVLSLFACASEPVIIDVDYLAAKEAYPPEPFIAVLSESPANSYVSIARLTVTGTPGLTQVQVLSALEERAKELGANAVIITNQSQSTVPDFAYNPAGGPSGQYPTATPAVIPKLVGLAIHIDNPNNPGS